MSNINDNQIDHTISDTDQTDIDAAKGTLENKLNPYLASLTDEQRERLLSMKDENLVFTQDALTQAQNNMSILPQPVQNLVALLETDLAFYGQLHTLETTFVNQLVVKIRDTKRLAAHEAYGAGLAIYKVYQILHEMGVEGATAPYLALKSRFEGQGRPADEAV